MQEEAPHSCGYGENIKNVQNDSSTPLPTPLPNHCSSSRILDTSWARSRQHTKMPSSISDREGRLQAGEMVDIVTALALLNGVAAAASRR